MEIDIKKLKESELFVEEFLLLLFIHNELNFEEFKWWYIPVKGTLSTLEENLWIKKVEDGYVLRDKGRKLFENTSNESIITNIILYLNKLTNKNFKPKSSANRKFINARLEEGYSEKDLKKVIEVMTSKWKNDPKMNMYLRPETLFNSTKFQTYINLIQKEDKDWTIARV